MTEPTNSAPTAFADEGLHESALVLGADSHPRFELAQSLLQTLGYKLTYKKQRRHEVLLHSLDVDDATLRAINSKNAYTVEQLFAWVGVDAPVERRKSQLRSCVETFRQRNYVRPSIEAQLEAWPDAQLDEAIATIDVVLRDVPNPWMQRALSGERDPRTKLCSRARVSRRAPREWVSAFVHNRSAFRRELTLELHSHPERIEPLREAIELLHGCPLHGLSIIQKDGRGASAAQLVDSLPEGLRSLDLYSVREGELDAFVDASSLRSVEELRVSSSTAFDPAFAKLNRAFEQLRSVELHAFKHNDTLVQTLCATRRIGALEKLAISRVAINDAALEALCEACPNGSLRSLELSALDASDDGVARFVTDPCTRNIEHLKIDPLWVSGRTDSAAPRFARESRMSELRSLHWRNFGISKDESLAVVNAMNNNSAFARLQSLTIRLIGADAGLALARATAPIALGHLELDMGDGALLANDQLWRCPWFATLDSLQISGGFYGEQNPQYDAMLAALPRLRSLVLSMATLDVGTVRSLASARFERPLRRLSCFASNYAPGVIEALCDSALVESLSELTLSSSGINEDDRWRLRRTFGPALWLV